MIILCYEKRKKHGHSGFNRIFSGVRERFVRGDKSRNTEGSGLGLAIAKSFVELQDGRFEIQLDGDLFK